MKHKRKKSHFKVAVIGAGGIGQDHVASFKLHPAAQVIAIADVSPERGRETAERFGIPEVFTDYRKVLARTDIDVVSIGVPNYLHARVALDALHAGKHVMLDKPMATNARDGAKLEAEAKARLLFMVGQNFRFNADTQTARQVVGSGELGEIYHAKTSWSRRAGIPRIGSWFTQKRYAGGGCTYDIGVHALDRCLFLMGEFDAAAAVSGQTYAKFGPRGMGNGGWGRSEIDPNAKFDVDDLSIALIKLEEREDGPPRDLVGGARAARRRQRDAALRHGGGAHAAAGPALQADARGLHDPVRRRAAPAGEHEPDVPLHRLPPRDVAKPFIKPTESVAVQKILDAIYQSAATGREIRIK